MKDTYSQNYEDDGISRVRQINNNNNEEHLILDENWHFGSEDKLIQNVVVSIDLHFWQSFLHEFFESIDLLHGPETK